MWQGPPGRIVDMLLATIEKDKFVFIERLEGTMHCYNFTALKKTSRGWEQVWEKASLPIPTSTAW
jgi:hypothetical protein